MTLSVGIFIFEGVEVLDFAGPYEVFTTASRVALRHDANKPAPFNVFTVAADKAQVMARAGLTVLPDWTFQDHPEIDVLVVPGGLVDAEQGRLETIQWIREISEGCRITSSICTGSFLLAEAGLLANKAATTHWEDIGDLRSQFPSIEVLENRRWVEQGSLITSAGISAGMHMSLHLVARLASEQLAVATAKQMEFDWCSQP